MLIFQKLIHREDLKANPKVFYVFGDNVQRKGFGGQAKEMRGEPNAIGVATKWSPSEFFDNKRKAIQTHIVYEDLQKVEEKLKSGHLVVWPTDHIGTGLADLQNRCPEVMKLINQTLARFKRMDLYV